MINEIVVYHGGTEPIATPICSYGRKNLDFGLGFYVTNLKEQSINWANNIAKNRRLKPVISRYKLNKEAFLKEGRCKIFDAYNEEWLLFIVENRAGGNNPSQYDYVEGGVANDRVIDTINLYIAGLIDIDAALKELSKHQPNNQICILNQELLDKHLIYDGTEEL
jgi:hypothetical protein